MLTNKATKNLGVHEGYLRLQDVLKLIPVSESTWWEGVKNGIYPSSKKLSPRTTAWSRSDINDLLTRIDLGDQYAKL